MDTLGTVILPKFRVSTDVEAAFAGGLNGPLAPAMRTAATFLALIFVNSFGSPNASANEEVMTARTEDRDENDELHVWTSLMVILIKLCFII